MRITRGLGLYRTDLDCRHPVAEKRKAEAERIRQKYPDRIPVRPFILDDGPRGGLIRRGR